MVERTVDIGKSAGSVAVIAQEIISGILLGGLYAVSGLGFSLVWGVMGVINLAHGSFLMLGAYTVFGLYSLAGIDPLFGLPVSMAFLFAVGYLLERTVLNYVFRYGFLMSMIVTFGVDLILVNSVMLVFSADYHGIQTAYASQSLELADVIIPYGRLIVFAISLIIVGCIHVFLARSRLGQAIQATSLNKDAAQLVGINIPHIYGVTFGLGAALAGGAGALIAILYSIFPLMGAGFLAIAFAITVLGGMGSVAGALAAGIVLGLAQGLGVYLLGPGYQQAMAFVILVVILVVRPTGLFGRRFFAGTTGN
jgi:branched-chain amino acid transport system permease protein